MLDGQELGQSGIDAQKASADSDTILANFRNKVPGLNLSPELQAERKKLEQEATTVVKPKMAEILQAYGDTPEKSAVSDLLSQTVANGCVAFGVDPVELIVIPRPVQQGENHVAMANRKKVGPMDIKQLFIDPEEIMFRVELLRQHGEATAKNVTDLVFVFMHEMTHLGQAVFAENDLKKSKQYEYANRPSEIHADEVALNYCRNLNNALEGKTQLTKADNVLQVGLPQTIRDADTYRRPSM